MHYVKKGEIVMINKNYGDMTKVLHAGWTSDSATGASTLPMYLTSAYQFQNSDHAARLFALEEEGHIYSRLTNPTVTAYEAQLAALEDGVGAVAFSSGQAAFTHLVTCLCSQGDNIVCSNKVYGGTVTLLKNVFSRFGIETRFVDGDHPCKFEEASDERTKLFITETIGNPLMNVAPLDTLGNIARRVGCPLAVDNTFAPYLAKPLEHGANIVVYSATKYISGQGTVVSGAVIDGGNFPWEDYAEKFPTLAKPDPSYHDINFAKQYHPAGLTVKLKSSIVRDLGGCPSAFDTWFLHTTISNLPLRMERHSQNALEIAKFLENHPAVEWVLYPGLPSHPQHDLAKVYLPRGAGGMLAFSVKGGVKAGKIVLDNLKLIRHMANLGDSRSIMTHPASTTHAQIPAEERAKAGITDGLIRFSVGIEDAADLKEELTRVLALVSE